MMMMIAVVVVVILLTTKNIIMIYPPVTKYNCIYTMHTYTYNISGRLKQIYKNLMHINSLLIQTNYGTSLTAK